MSNSLLVSYTKISPHKNVNRNHKIDTITIHCVVGQCSVETLGNVFSGTRKLYQNNSSAAWNQSLRRHIRLQP